MSCRLIWSRHTHTQRVYHGRSAGRVRVFFKSDRGISPRIVLSFAFSFSLSFFLPCCLASSRQPDRNQSLPDFYQIEPLRNVFHEPAPRIVSARVAPLACAYLLSCGSRRCKRVDASTVVWCGRRLIESSSVACTRLSLWQHPARQPERLPVPSLFPLSFSLIVYYEFFS